METRGFPIATVGGISSAKSESNRLGDRKSSAETTRTQRTVADEDSLVVSAGNRPSEFRIKQVVPAGEKLNEESRPKQGTMTAFGSAISVAESPRVPKMLKSGLNFVIPKNKLLGSMVPVNKNVTKWEAVVAKKEEPKPPVRKTKWGPDLTEDTAVKRGRALALQTRVEQLAAQLESGNLDIRNNDDTRSPSPPPLYDTLGHRMNTREVRKREQLDVERREAIGECIKLNSAYKIPSGYKPVAKEAKLYIPVKEYPGYNFIGLILGPRGNTQKRMEAETGAKITIRGKGAVKEGKMQSARNSKDIEGPSEELHVHISADCFERVDAAVALIEPLLTPVHEDRNMHKMKQLRELAEMNGTLNDFTKACSLCGEAGHKEWQCPKENIQAFQANVMCNVCGEHGHPTIDCPRNNPGKGATFDKEYVNFLQELGTSLDTSVTASQDLGPNVSQPMLLTTLGAQPIPARWMASPVDAESLSMPAFRGQLIGPGDAGPISRFPAPPLFQGNNYSNLLFPRFYQTAVPVQGQAFHTVSMPMMTSMVPALRVPSHGATGLGPYVPVTNAGVPPATGNFILPRPPSFGLAGEMGFNGSFPRGSQSDNNAHNSNVKAGATGGPMSMAPFPMQGTPDHPNSQLNLSSAVGPPSSSSSAATSGSSFSSNSGSNPLLMESARPVLPSASVHTISVSPVVVPSVRPVVPSIRPALSGSVMQHVPSGPMQPLSDATLSIGGMGNVTLPPNSSFPRPPQSPSGTAGFWSRPPQQAAPSFDRPSSTAIALSHQSYVSSKSQPLGSAMQPSNPVPVAAPSFIRAPSNSGLPRISSSFTAVVPPSQFVTSSNSSLTMQPGSTGPRSGFPVLFGSQMRANNPGNAVLAGSMQQMPVAQQNLLRPAQESPRYPVLQTPQLTPSNSFLQRAEVPPLRPPIGTQMRPEIRNPGILQNQQGILLPPPSLGNPSLSRPPLGPQEGFTPGLAYPRNPPPNFSGSVGSANVSVDPYRNRPDLQHMNGRPAIAVVRSWGPDPNIRPQPPRPQIQEVDPEYEKLMASVGVL